MKIPWRRAWLHIPVFLPGESHGQSILVGYSPMGPKESDMTEWWSVHTHACTHTQTHTLSVSPKVSKRCSGDLDLFLLVSRAGALPILYPCLLWEYCSFMLKSWCGILLYCRFSHVMVPDWKQKTHRAAVQEPWDSPKLCVMSVGLKQFMSNLSSVWWKWLMYHEVINYSIFYFKLVSHQI